MKQKDRRKKGELREKIGMKKHEGSRERTAMEDTYRE